MPIRDWASALDEYAGGDRYVELGQDECFTELGDGEMLIGSHPHSRDCEWFAITYNNEPFVIYTPEHLVLVPPEEISSPSIAERLAAHVPEEFRVQFEGPGNYMLLTDGTHLVHWRQRGVADATWRRLGALRRTAFGEGVRYVRLDWSA